MSDPDRIYLEPECCYDPDVGRCWSDDIPYDCDEGVGWSEYLVSTPRREASETLYEALEQAVTSMLDSGYATNSATIMAARQALSKARGES